MKTHLQQSRKPLQLGFIGGSIRSAVGYAHFTASGMDGHWQLVAGCFSQQAHINQESAQTYGVQAERTYSNLDEMLNAEQGKLDAIVVLTPTPDHFATVRACIKAGFAVICEKALAVSSAQARQLIQLREQYHGFLAVTYNYSGYPMVRELAEQISQGKLGKILHFQVEMPQEGFIRIDAKGNKPTPQPWRLADGNIPTLHLDLAVHLHQLISYLLDEKPIELVSDQNHYGWFAGVVDNATCLCRYSNDIQGQIWFSKSALGHRNGLKIRVYGTLGSAEWVQSNPEELNIAHIDGRREILDRAGAVEVSNQLRYNRFKAGHPAGFLEAFANLYTDIATQLQYHQKHPAAFALDHAISAEMAYEGLSFLEAMVISAKTRAWQSVALYSKPALAKQEVAFETPALDLFTLAQAMQKQQKISYNTLTSGLS